MMTTSIEAKLSREEYLKRYLSGSSDSIKSTKKKKKIQKTKAGVGMKIVEDDAFIAVAPESSSIPSDEDEREDLRREIEISAKLTEIAPKFVKGTFQAIVDSGEASTSERVPLSNQGSKRRHDSSGSDVSLQREPHAKPSSSLPTRTQQFHHSDDEKIKRPQRDSDSEVVRKRQPEISPGRDYNPELRSRRKSSYSPDQLRTTNSRDDSSPRRRSSKKSEGSQKGRRRSDSSDDTSLVQQRRHDSDSDLSPVRRRKEDSDNDVPRIRRRRNSPVDGGLSPVRRRRYDSDRDVQRKQRRRKEDSDNDVPRIRRRRNSPVDGGLSPVRRRRYDSDRDVQRKQRRRNDSDSDLSPARRHVLDSRRSGSSSKKQADWEEQNSIRDRDRMREQQLSKMSEVGSSRLMHERRKGENDDGIKDIEDGGLGKTLDGKAAGLQTAQAVRDEMQKLRDTENAVFEGLGEEISGRNAAAVRRSKMTGKGRETREEKEKKEREAKKQQELQEKYEKWNKGVQQIRERAERLDEMARVVKEDFTRGADDEAMNEHMKEILLADDPMLEHVKKKKLKTEMETGVVYPKYKGGWPPNRFMIAPGYRWDGVDRSNGFEARIAQTANQKVAEEREYYQNISKYE
uniref:BUD13 homolog n=2 Tax=Parascaris univalens TaxID=6257 RepID=A0A915AJ60_PARUN